MSKYDFEIDLSQNTSTGMILSRIQKGSTVLEFGCATGRMTRYMKEALDCRVYIVEYDEGAFKTALQYAEDGLCDDIMTFRWTEKFRGIAFDAIIFADVLEHLSAPEKVLEEASKLLKDSGCLYASIPNITHNDILLKAWGERFDYTPTGLLDDSHIHFWGLQNIAELSGKCGLHVRKIEATYCPIGGTEQHTPLGQNRMLENILRERPGGEIYQFIVTFGKGVAQKIAVELRPPSVKNHIYLDTGSGFNANELLSFESVLSDSGVYTACHTLEQTGNIRRIRFDPIEFQGCILKRISIRQADAELSLSMPGSLELAEGVFLPGDDPMVYAEVLPDGGPITIDAEIILSGEKFLQLMEEDCGAKHAAIESLHTETAGLTVEKQALCRTIDGLKGENRAIRNTAADLDTENGELRRDVGAYILLANNKDKYSLELEQERDRYIALAEDRAVRIRDLEQKAAQLVQERDGYIALAQERANYAGTLESAVQYYQNLEVVRLRTFILRVLRGIKRRIKRLLGK